MALGGCLGTLVLGVVAVVCVWWLLTLRSCSEEELAVLEGFPHYGERQIEPDFDEGSGGCEVNFVTENSRQEVIDYYSETLRERGWNVEVLEPGETVGPSAMSDPRRTTEVYEGSLTLSADRGSLDGLDYGVRFLPSETVPNIPLNSNRVYVYVAD